jgi:hypothetical protein
MWRARHALAGAVPAHEIDIYLRAGEPLPVRFPNNASCVDHSFIHSCYT